MHDANAPTQPPSSADDAAFEYARAIVRDGTDRSAAFWACIERAHAAATHPVPTAAPRRVEAHP